MTATDITGRARPTSRRHMGRYYHEEILQAYRELFEQQHTALTLATAATLALAANPAPKPDNEARPFTAVLRDITRRPQ